MGAKSVVFCHPLSSLSAHHPKSLQKCCTWFVMCIGNMGSHHREKQSIINVNIVMIWFHLARLPIGIWTDLICPILWIPNLGCSYTNACHLSWYFSLSSVSWQYLHRFGMSNIANHTVSASFHRLFHIRILIVESGWPVSQLLYTLFDIDFN